MKRIHQLGVEAEAYLREAKQHAVWAAGSCNNPRAALDHIASTRDALHEAAARLAERLKLEEAASDDLPW